MNLILCGLPACGKTSIGRVIAARLKHHFVDTDSLIEAAYAQETQKKLSCSEIYLLEGETVFRELETRQLVSLKELSGRHVIALGGGCLENAFNISLLQSLGTLLYLKSSPKLIWERIKQKGIPAFLDASQPEISFYEIARRRLPVYEMVANEIMDIDLTSHEDLVEAILKIGEKNAK